jgi:hypothetical protein
VAALEVWIGFDATAQLAQVGVVALYPVAQAM